MSTLLKTVQIILAVLRDTIQSDGKNLAYIVVGIITLFFSLLMFIILPVVIHERVPVAITQQQAVWYYNAAKIVSDSTASPYDDGVYIDWQDVIAIDAVRYKQNFKKSSAKKARKLAEMFIEQTGTCKKCSGEGKNKNCNSYPLYRLRDIEEVMNSLHMSKADQSKVLSQYRVIDFNFLIGFEPTEVGDCGVLYSGDLTWPVPGHHQISSPFGMRKHPITGRTSMHYGIDIPAEAGTKIVAANDGRVKSVEWSDAVGWTITIDHGTDKTGKRLITRYLHCMDIQVRPGGIVSNGQPIGYVGNTDNMGYLSTGPHLHFETLIDYVNKDPANFFCQK